MADKIKTDTLTQTIGENKQNDYFSFDDCLKKYFPVQALSLSMINEITGIYSSLYEITLSILKDYRCQYELKDMYLGALIMHVKLGNLSGYNLEDLFKKLNYSEEFKNDVLYRLQHNKNDKLAVTKKFNKQKKDTNISTSNLKPITDNAVKLKNLISKAESGNAEVQLLLGDMYLQGNGVEEDDVEAVKWYSMAVANGNAEAMNRLGEMYQYGYGVKVNDEEAVKWYKKAAEKNSPNGQFRLGWMYEAGRGGLSKDINMALKYYRLAAEQGHKVAIIYASRKGNTPDLRSK